MVVWFINDKQCVVDHGSHPSTPPAVSSKLHVAHEIGWIVHAIQVDVTFLMRPQGDPANWQQSASALSKLLAMNMDIHADVLPLLVV